MIRLLIAALLVGAPASAETTLKVMSFNIWGAGAYEGKPIDQTVAAIRAAGADVVGIQETRTQPATRDAEVCPATGPSVAADLAAALGWHVHEQSAENVALWSNAMISRYPIGKASPNQLGVALDVDGVEDWILNVHLDDAPYQPYQLLGIEYGPFLFIRTEAEAQTFADATRGPAMALLAADLAAAEGAAAVFVTGDFKSLRGWTGPRRRWRRGGIR